ncbi:MAG TPA: hypothetical protein DCZ00_07320 [Lactococcus sp.]|nr:hypothetical protein [Lactococcus sp.]HBC91235.1 hypothetical protein [Lactococcus sp.]
MLLSLFLKELMLDAYSYGNSLSILLASIQKNIVFELLHHKMLLSLFLFRELPAQEEKDNNVCR